MSTMCCNKYAKILNILNNNNNNNNKVNLYTATKSKKSLSAETDFYEST